MKPLIVILMGSKADMSHAEKIMSAAKIFGLDVEIRVGSAHKTADHVLALLKAYEADPRPKVYITIAGRSNALSGFTDGAVSAPVIACPPYSEKFGGADVYSSISMPSGIAPALVLEPVNAALLAAKIFAVTDPQVRKAVEDYQRDNRDTILADDAAVKAENR
ncbi:MAG: AIR carboxylase family protein [Chloroflexi bacterium]|nr:AIR carboxylase family protein [Chloroflexota bacterium]BCY18018.1 phosphoribosylaminoimidazole carboxylase [Leptolinea sp. HRD-7]